MEKPNKLVVYGFRYVSIAEGISFLVLLLIAMPLKYVFDMPLAVKYVGWAHGGLFVAYIAMAFLTSQELKWKFFRLFLAFVASVVPFGPFIFDKSVHKEYLKKTAEETV